MSATLTFFHVGLLLLGFALVNAAVATWSLARFLAAIESGHAELWRSLGSPRIAGMAPEAGPRIYAYLKTRAFLQLDDPVARGHAQRAWVLGLGTVADVVLAALAFGLFFAGVDLPGSVPAPF